MSWQKKTMLKNKAATISVEVNWKWNSVLATNMRPWLLLFRLNLGWDRHSWNRFTNLRHQALKMSMDSMMPGIQGRLSKQRPLVENCYKNPLETCLPTIFPSNNFFCNETPLSQLMTGGLNEVAPWGPWKSRRWRMQIHLKNQHLDVLSQDLTICESWFVLHVEFLLSTCLSLQAFGLKIRYKLSGSGRICPMWWCKLLQAPAAPVEADEYLARLVSPASWVMGHS